MGATTARSSARLVSIEESCRALFHAFVVGVMPKFDFSDHHDVICRELMSLESRQIERLLIEAPPRHALAVDTPIQTTRGWKSMGEIEVGDYVYAPNGTPVAVTGVSDVFKGRECWTAITDDGAQVECDAEHLWTVRLDRKREYWKTYTTKMLADREAERGARGAEIRAAMLPAWNAVWKPKADLPVDPWVLGVWIGDGSSWSGTITQAEDDQTWLRAEIERRGYTTTQTEKSHPQNFRIRGLQSRLRDLGILRTEAGVGGKTIPEMYMNASVEQRMDLLRGLMDTDGNVNVDGQQFLNTSSVDLKDQYCELLRSLGIKASPSKCRARIGQKEYGYTWKISFYAENTCSMPRKAARTRKYIRKVGRYLRFVPCGVRDTRCIRVDSDDGLFLAGRGYVVTHNSKTLLTSTLFAAWYLGRNPTHEVVLATYSQERADDLGKALRDVIRSEAYRAIFPGVALRRDSQSVSELVLESGGSMHAVGVGGALTGRGAHALIVDDPIKDRKDADSPTMRRRLMDWYSSVASTRLYPDAVIVIMACMVGDTKVTMSDGAHKNLRDICVGDRIATWSDGAARNSIVDGWKSQGNDNVFEIKTAGGFSTKANARHPFLVARKGTYQWVRLRNLRLGDKMVRLRTDSIVESNVQRLDAECLPNARVNAPVTTINGAGVKGIARLVSLTGVGKMARVLNIVTESVWRNTKRFLNSRMGDVLYAARIQSGNLLLSIHSALTTTTQREEFAGCSAIPAILQSDTSRHQRDLMQQPHTSDFILDEVVSVLSVGVQEVFDVQIRTTENFIADGFVSHNTRWHKDDLTGQILEADPRHALWKEIRMPAICDDAERDPVQRQYGAALWPKWFPVEKLNAIRNDPPGMIDRDWFALYQQRPVAETGDEFQRAWFEARWNDPLPVVLNMYGCSDFGVTEAGDPTEHGIFGIDPLYRIYVVDWWSGKATPDVWIERMLDLSQKWKVRRWFGEGGVIRHAVNPLLTRRMRERQVFVPLKWLNPIGNKTMRAQGFRGRAAAGTVLFPKRQWADAVIDQLCEFPAGKHDDKVDVCGMIGRVLDEIRNGREKRVEADGTDPTKDLKPFTAAWLEYEEKKPNDMRYC